MKLSDSVQFIRGIGPQRAESLARIGIHTLEDLLFYFPRRYVDRSQLIPLSHLRINQEATGVARVTEKKMIEYGKKRLVVTLTDGTDRIQCIFFNRPQMFQRIFSEGQTVFFSGKVTFFMGKQIVHPEYQIVDEEADLQKLARIIPLYPWSKELEQSHISHGAWRKMIYRLLFESELDLNEKFPPWICLEYGLMNFSDALRQMHFPESDQELERAHYRFVFEEGFFLLLLLNLRYQSNRRSPGIQFQPSQGMLRHLVDQLPYQLTRAQIRVINDIYRDMTSPHQMNRLLQGDVGSGKTVVALIAMLLAYENGCQAILMAPTEILAEQHFLNIRQFTNWFGIEPLLLVGSQKNKTKMRLREEIAQKVPALIIGTHALIQNNVNFARPGLIVIDEQHRFGVMQRGVLTTLENNPDILIMTATPIPRTLAMTLYGDMDVSLIDEMPPGRKPIINRAYTQNQIELVYRQVEINISEGGQIYFVYPLIEESEKLDLKAAQSAFEEIQRRFPQVATGLLHGRMKAEEKSQVMDQFKRGEIKILVSTTVIEVGVDVPQANLMVIEHAERFGLAQLHQLRGRVGRGHAQSSCLFVTADQLTEDAKKRISVMTTSNDGFKIAEEDLAMRGPGELMGTTQAGLPPIRMMEIFTHQKLLTQLKELVRRIVESDQHLIQPAHQSLRSELFARYGDKLHYLEIA